MLEEHVVLHFRLPVSGANNRLNNVLILCMDQSERNSHFIRQLVPQSMQNVSCLTAVHDLKVLYKKAVARRAEPSGDHGDAIVHQNESVVRA